MMKTVKHTFYTIGDHSSDLARTIGSGTADLARTLGSGTADFAKTLGSGTAHLAKRIGPKRGLLGLLAVAAAIGGTVVLVRYLRARNLNREELDVTASDVPNGKTSKRSYGGASSSMPGTH